MNNLIEKIDNLILFFLVYSLIFIIFFGTLNYTLPFVLALIFAFILQKPSIFLVKKFKLRNSSAALITTLIFSTIAIGLISWVIAIIANETIMLGKNLQMYVSNNSYNIQNTFYDLKKYYNNLDSSLVTAINTNLSSFTSKTVSATISISTYIVNKVISFLTSIPYMLMVIFFSLISTYFFTKDLSSAKNKIISIIPDNKINSLILVFNESKKMILNYITSYAFLLSLTFFECLIGFLLIGVRYSFLLSLLCSILDFLPVLGIFLVYVPLIIFYFLSGNYFSAFSLIILYILITIVRQFAEPKIVSSSLGIHPVAILAALFIGLKAYGFIGMLYCIFLVVFYTILRKVDIL